MCVHGLHSKHTGVLSGQASTERSGVRQCLCISAPWLCLALAEDSLAVGVFLVNTNA